MAEGHIVGTRHTLDATSNQHETLAEVAHDVDWDEARSAAALIVERGFGRGRDLVSALDLLRSDGAY